MEDTLIGYSARDWIDINPLMLAVSAKSARGFLIEESVRKKNKQSWKIKPEDTFSSFSTYF